MSPQQVIAVSVRLFAIWLFVYFILNLASIYITVEQYDDIDSLQPLFWSIGVTPLISGLLWFFPLFISKKILPPFTTDIATTPVFEDWFSVGCSLIGVWLLVISIPALSSYLIGHYIGLTFSPDSLWLVQIGRGVFLLMSFSLS